MKILLACAFCLISRTAIALPADITYVEGEASIRFGSGKTAEAVIGDVVNTGDTVRTGPDGLVELDSKGVVLKISPGTVMTLMERERGGKKVGVLSVALGSLKMKYGKLTGQEPMVATVSCAAGVRGTELSVYAGADGSSLIAVDSGAVEVEAQGTSVELAQGEGVEVKPGEPPGAKFVVQRDQTDYRAWNDRKLATMLEDPASAVGGITQQLVSYAESVQEYNTYFREYSRMLAEERQKAIAMVKERGKEEARKYEVEVVYPLTVKTANLVLNLRYYALAALSLRRYVVGRMYAVMKARFISKPADPSFAAFLTKYAGFLATFEQFIVPQLVEADI